MSRRPGQTAGWLFAGALTLAALVGGAGQAQSRVVEGITARQALETARVMKNPMATGPGNPDGLISVSPDGRRYVLRIVKGNVAADRVEVELFAGSLTSLDAATPILVAKLSSSGLGTGGSVFGAVHDVDEYGSPLRWLDDHRLAFLFTDAAGVRQVVVADIDRRTVEYLTRHPTNVVGFDIAPDGSLFYNAQAATPPSDFAGVSRAGYVIGTGVDASSLFRRDVSGRNLFDAAWATQWFHQPARARSAEPLTLFGRAFEPHYAHNISLSPDGRLALINATADTIPATWSAYKEREIASRIAVARTDPSDSDARSVHRLYVVDLAKGEARPLWDAVALVNVTRTVWSPDGRFVIATPTFLPPADDDTDSLGGSSAAVIEVATGRYVRLPLQIGGPLRVAAVRWETADRIELDMRQGPAIVRHTFVLADGAWRTDGEPRPLQASSGIRIEQREGLDQPPRLFAVDGASGHERQLWDLNPGLGTTIPLGRAARVQGTTSAGDPWTGLLFYPPDHEAGRRYPLVIQSVYGMPVTEAFSLYGVQSAGGLGPSPLASYPGRALAARGVLVLQMDVMMGRKFGTSQEAAARQAGFEAAIAQLDQEGLIDRAKVGLVGFSRNGFYVDFTLTHSDTPFAAAISADNWDPSYASQTLTSSMSAGVGVTGAEPFGTGLADWLERAPAFSADRVETPLMMLDQSQGVFGAFLRWEMFSRLRYLKKPVEFYVMPDAEAHGAHNTQNPRQVLAVMQRSIDWFDFWLNGHEDPDPAKADQYAGWRGLRALQLDAVDRARPPSLHWAASPRPPG